MDPTTTLPVVETDPSDDTPVMNLHTIAEDDTHVVATIVDPPTRDLLLYRDSPTLDPTTVTLIAPVVAALDIKVELPSPPFIVTCIVIVPATVATDVRTHR